MFKYGEAGEYWVSSGKFAERMMDLRSAPRAFWEDLTSYRRASKCPGKLGRVVMITYGKLLESRAYRSDQGTPGGVW